MANRELSVMPWERQKGESVQAFAAFEAYCSMGEKRSIRAVAQKCSKNASLIARWSSRWDWQTRSREYDREITRAEMKEMQRRKNVMLKRQMNIAELMQKKGYNALKNLDENKLTPREILAFITEGAMLEAEKVEASIQQSESADENTSTSLAGEIPAVKQTEQTGLDLSRLTDEDLRALAAMKGDDDA